MGTIPASENEYPEVLFAEGAAPGTPGSGLVKAYAKSDGLLYSKDDAGAETALGGAGLATHLADTADAHDASAISFSPTGTIAATDVQAAIAEVASEAAAGGIPGSIVDAAGDLIIGTAADTVARLAVGATAGMNLQSNGTTAVWALPKFYGCMISEATAQSISDDAAVVAMTSNDAEIIDTSGYHDTSSNTSRITIPTGLGGYYYFFAEVFAASDTTAGYMHLQFRPDGSGSLANTRIPRITVGTTTTYAQISWFGLMNAAQYMELMVGQQAGNALNLTMVRFGCHLIGV